MNKLEIERGLLKKDFEELAKVVEELITKGEKEKGRELNAKFKRLELLQEKLMKVDEALNEEMFSKGELSQEELVRYKEAGEYLESFFILKSKYEEFVGVSQNFNIQYEGEQQKNGGILMVTHKHEITKKFGGDLGEWIGFWTQFSAVHNSRKKDEEKFDILLRALKPNSPALRLIESFPPSAENYSKALDLLKTRFGKEEHLIEYYVRKLLSLVSHKSDGSPLSELYDKLEAQLRALESIDVTKEKYAAMLFPLVESIIPENIFLIWDRYRASKNASMKKPEECLAELMSFLKLEVEGEERLKLRNVSFASSKNSTSKSCEKSNNKSSSSETVPTAAALLGASKAVKSTVRKCVFCEKPHPSQDCQSLHSLSVAERVALVQSKNICYRCLFKGHNRKDCKAFVKCFVCQSRLHYPVLCPQLEKKLPPKETTEATSLAQSLKESVTYLQTVQAKIKGKDGQSILVRILLDSGSQKSYIAENLAKLLNLPVTDKVSLTHEVFGGNISPPVAHHVYKVTLSDLEESFTEEFFLMDHPKICTRVPSLSDSKMFRSLKERGITLSDFDSQTSEVHILLGADVWAKILKSETVRVGPELLAINTVLGWTLIGQNKSNQASLLVSTFLNNTSLSNFWDLELLGIKDPGVIKKRVEKDKEVLDFFYKTVTRNENNGRYIVRLPWVQDFAPLEDNRNVAISRLMSTTRKLKEANIIEAYDTVFKTWLELGIIEVVPEDEVNLYGFYLPHRAVVKSEGTTKIRPVFDASCKDKNGRSLNSMLEAGPNLIELIPKIIIDFRKRPVGVTADIEKAFLQIELDPKDRNVLRFLWWEKDKIITMRHCRVVFGVTSSPFLLVAVLMYILETAPENLLETANKLKGTFYVDNCITSLEDSDALNKFIQDSEQLFLPAGINLRGWISNLTCPDKVEKVLGLMWYCGDDKIGVNLKMFQNLEFTPTRRHMLSVTQQVFDPIGFTAPATITLRILLQQTWGLKIGWDDPLPDDISQGFKAWLNNVHFLKDCTVPRHIFPQGRHSLHVFCDASKLAYGVCIFVRSVVDKEVSVSLVMAKSRVAPTKALTIPRLELMAVVIGVRLYQMVLQEVHGLIEDTYFWTDSSVVLCWLKGEGPWSVFVSNRIQEIKEGTDVSKWSHIPGDKNPADILTRGCSPQRLSESRWWEGPQWLFSQESEWPSSAVITQEDEALEELRKSTLSAANIDSVQCFLNFLAQRLSRYRLIVGVVARLVEAACKLCPDFIRYCNMMGTDHDEENVPSNVINAELLLFRAIQREYFSTVAGGEALKSSDTFVDEFGLRRVKLRWLSTNVSAYPILLPGKHPLIQRLIEHEHRVNKHAGVGPLITIIRERIWLLKGRRAVNFVVHRCLYCQKQRVKPIEVPTPPLPKDRTDAVATFATTGVDLAGPLFLKGDIKCWIIIFTCAVYRAVHLDLVLSLSSEAVLQALRRFIARRGRPNIIYSDNGRNFVGVNNLMSSLPWDKIEKECGLLQIHWKFIPPTGAWWGGFWERLIGILKTLLRKNLGRAVLDYEELSTLLLECERIMNNRPLTYMTDDFRDLVPLTPAMFLMSLSGCNVDDLDQLEGANLSKRYNYLQKIREALRERFKKEYLAFLKGIKKNPSSPIVIGDVFLVEQIGRKRYDWTLGRVVEVMPGRDGVTRVVKLKTKDGEIVRPAQRLYRLEVGEEERRGLDVREEEDTREEETREEDETKEDETAQEDAEKKNDKKRHKGKKKKLEEKPYRTRYGRISKRIQ